MTQDELLTKPAGVMIKTTLVDFPGKVASTYFLRGCNLRCPYCYNTDLVQISNTDTTSKETQPQLVSPLTLLEHLYKRKNVIQGLVISGGEPLLNPVTPLLIKKAKALGLKIKLDTNGTLPLLLDNLVKNEETRPDFIAMDIKTSPERYSKDIHPIKNFQNADIKELLKASIDIIKELGNENYEIRTVLVPGLVEKEDIKNIASILPADCSWRFAQFRNENCIDPSYNQLSPYLDRELTSLTDYAKTFIADSILR